MRAGTRIDTARLRPGHPRGDGGRVCGEASCATVLSIYNSSALCWIHQTPAPFHGTNVMRDTWRRQ